MKDLSNIELFVFDLDGTVYIGNQEIDGSYKAIEDLRKMGKKICFFTNNSSRHHLDYVKRLNDLGLKASENEIYTSGQVTAEYLLDYHKGEKVYLLGNDRLKKELNDYGIEVVDENPDICLIGFDTSLTYDRLYQFCKYVNSGIPYFATHPDNFCPFEGCNMPDIGAMIEMIRLSIDKVPDLIMGKPHNIAGARIEKRYGVKKENIAMVGDRLYTDIAFGNNCGFTSILVLSGETDQKMADESDIKADVILNKVKEIPTLIK